MTYQTQNSYSVLRGKNLVPDVPYSELNFNTTIEVDELNQLRQRLEQNIGYININRQRIRHQEFNQLMNYHQYALNTLDNMIQIKKVEYNNPYNQNARRYRMGQLVTPFQSLESTEAPDSAIYDDKLRVKVVKPNSFRHREEWEMQFDQNVINPPCYLIPPTSCYGQKTDGNRG